MTNARSRKNICPLADLATPPEVAAAAGVSVVRLQGSRSLIGQPAIGICGARDATDHSIELASKFGHLAAKAGFGVVAGNARGVDAAAQQGALEAGGWTVAVLAEGLGGWKPRVPHRPLINESNFAAISSYEDDARWLASRAMARNKLIVAFSQALVVVQARTKGGTWDAGNECLRQEKPLLVVEHGEKSPETEGNEKLLERGGIPVGTTQMLHDLLQRLRDEAPLPEGSQERLI